MKNKKINQKKHLPFQVSLKLPVLWRLDFLRGSRKQQVLCEKKLQFFRYILAASTEVRTWRWCLESNQYNISLFYQYDLKYNQWLLEGRRHLFRANWISRTPCPCRDPNVYGYENTHFHENLTTRHRNPHPQGWILKISVEWMI